MAKTRVPKQRCNAITKSTKERCKKDVTEKGKNVFCSAHSYWDYSGPMAVPATGASDSVNTKIIRKIHQEPVVSAVTTEVKSDHEANVSVIKNQPQVINKIKIVQSKTDSAKKTIPTWKSVLGRDEGDILQAISWVITTVPSSAQMFDENDDIVDLTDRHWNSIVFDRPVKLEVPNFNSETEDDYCITCELKPDTSEGSTLKHTLETAYRAMCSYPDWEKELEDWPENVGNHVYFEGFRNSVQEPDTYCLDTGS